MDFSGKRALVTGAASGIGRATAIALCKAGAVVFALDCNEKNLNVLKNEYPELTTIHVDLMKWDETREAVAPALPLELVVNSAGVGGPDNCLTATPDKFDSMFGLNVRALWNICQMVGNDLVTRKMKGSFVNLSSIASTYLGQGTHFTYSLSKCSVDMLTRQFALALGPSGIRVNAVNPSLVKTGMADWMLKSSTGKLLEDASMLGIVGADMENVVEPILFLLSDSSKVITGHTLPVDGGITSR